MKRLNLEDAYARAAVAGKKTTTLRIAVLLDASDITEVIGKGESA
jgi:hypothetical protein